MDYVIVMLLANALGQPVAIGVYPTHYATVELCETARPAAVLAVQNEVNSASPGGTVVNSKCVTQDEIDKASDKSSHPPLKGQRDARIYYRH